MTAAISVVLFEHHHVAVAADANVREWFLAEHRSWCMTDKPDEFGNFDAYNIRTRILKLKGIALLRDLTAAETKELADLELRLSKLLRKE